MTKPTVWTTRATELSLLMLDVDLFKQFNDLYGHIAGDECLKSVAETLTKTIQRDAADLVARYGGAGYFVVLLPGTNAVWAAHGGRKTLLAAIENLGIEHAGSPYSVLTISIGLASCCGMAPIDRCRLLEQFDAALLYAAKRLRSQPYLLHRRPFAAVPGCHLAQAQRRARSLTSFHPYNKNGCLSPNNTRSPSWAPVTPAAKRPWLPRAWACEPRSSP